MGHLQFAWPVGGPHLLLRVLTPSPPYTLSCPSVMIVFILYSKCAQSFDCVPSLEEKSVLALESGTNCLVPPSLSLMSCHSCCVPHVVSLTLRCRMQRCSPLLSASWGPSALAPISSASGGAPQHPRVPGSVKTVVAQPLEQQNRQQQPEEREQKTHQEQQQQQLEEDKERDAEEAL